MLKEMTMDELMMIDGGERELYQTVVSGITGVLTGGNPYAMLGSYYAAGKHYDKMQQQYKNYKFDPNTYKHPYRNF